MRRYLQRCPCGIWSGVTTFGRQRADERISSQAVLQPMHICSSAAPSIAACDILMHKFCSRATVCTNARPHTPLTPDSGHLDDCKIAAPLHQSHTGGECRMFRQNIPLENTEWLHSACVIRRIECTIAWRSFECFFYSAASGRQKTKTCLQHKNLITCLPASHTYTNKGAYAPPATRRPIECIRCRSTLKR